MSQINRKSSKQTPEASPNMTTSILALVPLRTVITRDLIKESMKANITKKYLLKTKAEE